MRLSVKVGFSFGLASGVITTLGLLLGVYSGTGSRLAVLGAIFTIALVDALSDTFGLYAADRTKAQMYTLTARDMFEAAVAAFFTKAIVALSFAVPIVLLPLDQGVVVAVAWGALLLGAFGPPTRTALGSLLLVLMGMTIAALSWGIGSCIKDIFGD